MNPYLRPTLSRRQLIRAGLSAAALGGLAACGSDGTSSSAPPATGTPVSSPTSAIPVGGGTIFADAKTVVTQPKAGEFKAFSSICTHASCPVADVTTTINCNCHGSAFSLTDGAVVAGPAPSALPAKTVTVSGDTLSVPA
ncbi:Rieske (2Fe-2S) protein [uncultured Friedmanniella sp.]|uniref:Rieske (2Fe-2S) protein n=1 Tax=uncultured Friedmanniella sp. TaxID=335381 RepID=UPI0035CB9F63